ncbi:MAG: type II toxin-antitoxin system VapC family toxin [Lewinellaceae bacterium]|nr:type II toxin-antitoxin system VapC family toxin [Lewinellaceae bacterium]
MVYLLDTNILLLSLISTSFDVRFRETYKRSSNDFIISVVTEGELKSLAFQRRWGEAKQNDLQRTLEKLIIFPIKIQSVIDAYARIDAFSQGKLADMALTHGLSSRNMGKNDLWIAATAHVTGATLITADKDFGHLSPYFLKLEQVDVQAYL